jgi:hypothetical protein
MAGKITNRENIRRKVSNSRKYQDLMRRRVERRVDKTKKILLSRFNAHPVTRELEGGANASNISGLLGGYGNLFSYIGFRAGSNPILALRRLLLSIRILRRAKKGRKQGSMIVDTFTINFPTPIEIKAVSKMPWEPKSWAFGIEDGIDGFGHYMSTRFKGGRSKTGLQTENEINDVSFRTDKYLPTMLLEAKRIMLSGK